MPLNILRSRPKLRRLVTSVVLPSVIVGGLLSQERSLIYKPPDISAAQLERLKHTQFQGLATELPSFGAIVVEPPAGVHVIKTAILFHGNGAIAAALGSRVAPFHAEGIRLILAEYPGYAGRPGSPSQKSLVEDGLELYREVLTRYPQEPVMLVGESLGTGVVAQVTHLAPSAGLPVPSQLVLITPFESMARTATEMTYLPLGWAMKDTYYSDKALQTYSGPVSMVVAEDDEVVGADQGLALAKLVSARGPTSLVRLPGAGHNTWRAHLSESQWAAILSGPADERPHG